MCQRQRRPCAFVERQMVPVCCHRPDGPAQTSFSDGGGVQIGLTVPFLRPRVGFRVAKSLAGVRLRARCWGRPCAIVRPLGGTPEVKLRFCNGHDRFDLDANSMGTWVQKRFTPDGEMGVRLDRYRPISVARYCPFFHLFGGLPLLGQGPLKSFPQLPIVQFGLQKYHQTNQRGNVMTTPTRRQPLVSSSTGLWIPFRRAWQPWILNCFSLSFSFFFFFESHGLTKAHRRQAGPGDGHNRGCDTRETPPRPPQLTRAIPQDGRPLRAPASFRHTLFFFFLLGSKPVVGFWHSFGENLIARNARQWRGRQQAFFYFCLGHRPPAAISRAWAGDAVRHS